VPYGGTVRGCKTANRNVSPHQELACRYVFKIKQQLFRLSSVVSPPVRAEGFNSNTFIFPSLIQQILNMIFEYKQLFNFIHKVVAIPIAANSQGHKSI